MDTKALRQKILDLAIHGKLVPQDPNDEPASVLLERIKAEKERLIKEGKIKRSKKSAKTSDTPHYPYLLPKGWKWCKLEDIVSFGGGKTPSMDNKEYWDNGKHLWVTSKDMKCSHITNSLMKITDKALVGMTLYEKGTLLVVTRSGILRHTLPLSILEKPATVNQDLKTISPHIQELSEYLYVIIKANEHIILKEYHKDGTTVDSIDFDKFRCLPIPLAPIAEQKRIIAETKNWLSLIDQIEQGKADLQTTIKQTKSKILDLAIHGKLVPQDPNDEPAVELLKRINPNFTPRDNGHYTQLPDGWCECQLENIVKYEQPQAYIVKSTDYDDRYLTPVLTAGKSFIIGYTNEIEGIYQNTPCIIFDDFTTDSKLVDFPFKVKSSAMKILRVADSIEIEYVAMFMNITRLIGDTHKRYWISEYSKLCIPIPPKEEQKRITNAVNVMFEKLDTIMENL
ncbi:restriction endonuclease subunit S [Bacteroides stercoris]|uniref:restriction endonuclease subunit S n=1 Tax=Bacteroides stercoris TaxID=46506 RepID=UPI0022E3EF05|nr:restriction endonuclease subunit S [Bacteroides stercoris]